MSKFNTFAAYPAIATLALAATFSAQAQSMNDPADQAAYGAMPAATRVATTVAAKASPAMQTERMGKSSLFAGWSARSAAAVDSVDQAAYGAMPAASLSLRTRAEVRAEAIAARDSGSADYFSEGGDPQHAALARAKRVDGDHVYATRTATKAAQ